MDSSPSRSWRKWLFAVLAVLVTLLAVVALRQCDRASLRDHASSASDSVAPVSSHAPASVRNGDAGAAGFPSPAPLANAARMKALTFVISSHGLRLQDSVAVAGRVKAPPRSIAPNRIEFRALDPQGRVVFEGAVDHPLHRIDEYEAADRPGELRRIEREVEEEAFQLRIPADVGAVRVALVEVLARGGRETRRALGEFPLP